MKTLDQLASQLAWLFEEAKRGYLDPKGKDWERVRAFVLDLVQASNAHALDAIRQLIDEEEPFAQVYDQLAAEGRCDSWGGMESRRVYREWLAAGKPSDIHSFILDHAR